MSNPSGPNINPGGKTTGWKIFLGLLISAIFLGLALYNINFSKVVRTFSRVQPLWLPLGCASILSAFYFRSLIWRQLLHKQCPPHMWDFYRIITIGYLGNNLLPLKLGEVLKAWLLSQHEKIPASMAFATVVLERGLDLLALLVYFILMMFVIPFENWLKLSGLILAGFGMVLLLGVVLNYRFGGHLLDTVEKPLTRLPGNTGPWLHQQIDKFLEGLKLIDSLPQFLLAFLFTLLSWLSWILMNYFCFQAAGLHLPLYAPVFLMVVLNFGLMIPSSPGGLGVFEFMVILALAKFGVEKEAALSVGFICHMLVYLFVLIIGWIFAIQMNVSMFKFPRAAAESEAPDSVNPEKV